MGTKRGFTFVFLKVIFVVSDKMEGLVLFIVHKELEGFKRVSSHLKALILLLPPQVNDFVRFDERP